uniref:Uncharacterized protein n=1 Tax=Brassica oleracea var. oleracea TaxID=109376 RepID=A0A0D3CCJ1_BRAOL
MFSWNQFLSSSSNPNHSIFSLASDLHLLLGKSSSSFRFPPLLLHSETSPNEGVLKQTGPARPPPLPPPPQFCEIPATTSPSPPSDPEKREETLKPKLKPLHWDKVRASSSHVMVLDQTKSNSFQVNEEMIETLFRANDPSSRTRDVGNAGVRAKMQWSAIMLTYGFPLAIIGMALKYAELKPVPCLSYADAVKLRESSATPILTQVRNDVTRYRNGDEQHLEEALKRIFQYGLGGGIPRRSAPILTMIKEEVYFSFAYLHLTWTLTDR